MANLEAKRQKKLARKRTKDKSRLKQIANRKLALVSGFGKMTAGGKGEIIGCYRCDGNVTEEINGMVPVLLVRKGPQGMLAAANFLVDFWCMGVKDCLFQLDSPLQINNLISDMDTKWGLVDIDPSVGRAMVELGVGFANTLGIAPHSDYRIAKLLWGDVELGELPDDVKFGVDGKPRYIVGPHDSPARQSEILHSLRTSVGEGNFDFIVGGMPILGSGGFLD